MKNVKNKGLTLIEMVVAFAVLGIAVFGIGGFFVSAARSYSSVSDETSLQYEAQLALNQVENMLIDSTLGVSYNYVTSTGNQFVEKDAEASGTAVSKVLYAYNISETAGQKLDIMLLKWDEQTEAIYYKSVQVTDLGSSIEDIDISGTEGSWDLLAEDVKSFSVDLSEYITTKKVEIGLGFENRSKDYETSGTVVLRNNVLINETSIQAVYNRITKTAESIITGVQLSSNTNVTVPGGAVQLFTNLSGDGYPETLVTQWQWLVALDSNFENVIYDSLVNYQTLPKTYIDISNKVLRVSDDTTGEGSSYNETLWVKVVVETKNEDGAGNPIKLQSESLMIGVKLISNITVTVDADTTQDYNSNLAGRSFPSASLSEQRANASNIPQMELHPRNVVMMETEVTASDTITVEEQEVSWSIISKTEGVIAEIDNDGLLKVNQYSKVGSFVVRTYLKMDSMVYVDYIVNVVSEYTKDNTTLTVATSKSTINRGGSLDCSLTLNGVAADNNDYDWSLSVISSNGQEITGTPVTVNQQGIVYANYDLSYDYSYDVWVKAALKTNPEIAAMARISVPKVSLSISPPITYSKMGTTVSGITCTAIGLEKYDIRWTMSKEINPNHFFAAMGNFNITGGKNNAGQGTATVVMGSVDDRQTNCTIKATLKDNSNYQATMRIFSADVKMNITGNTTVSRGETVTLNVSSNSTQVPVSKDSVTWEITGVKANGSTITGWTKEDLSISKGVLAVGENFASAYENYAVTITIRAYDPSYGLEDTHDVTVNAMEVKVKPKRILIPDGSAATKIQYPSYSGITWSVSRQSGARDKISINSSTGVLSAVANDKGSSDNGIYSVNIRRNGRTEDTGYVAFGFETNRSVPNNHYVGQKKDGWRNYNYYYEVGQSQYFVLKNGEECPVFYANYYRTRYNSRTDLGTYAFVSNTKNVNGQGQWYQYSNSQWNIINSAPSDWKNQYFD